MELKNDTILITGGTSGFGYEFAAKLLSLGNTVIITGRSQEKLDETKRKLKGVHTFKSDVSDPAAITALFEQVTNQFPALNLLINNAGEMRKLNLLDPTLDQHNVSREIEINLLGPVRMVQQFLPHLVKQSSAAILNVTSGIALVPFPVSPVYGATKAGLRSYTRSLRAQLKKTNIKVFELLAPGASTPLNDKFAGLVDAKMLMAADKLVDQAIEGILKNRYEIFPGLSKVIYLMSRLAPNLIFKQMAGLVDKAFYNTKK